MKKLVTALLTMALLVSTMTVIAFAEGETSYNGFVYSDMGEEIYITDYVGAEKEITVPATIAGKPVTQVYTTTANDTVTSITLEEGITHLGHAALMDYTALTTVYLPSTMESLGQNAIIHAPNVENVFVAEGCEYFVDVDGVLYEKIWRYQVGPDGQILFDEPIVVDGYGLRAYPAAKTNTSYTVLDKVEDYAVVQIAERAFSGAKNLETLVIPKSVYCVYYGALEECKSLKTLTMYNMKYMEELPEGMGDDAIAAIFGYYYDEVKEESFAGWGPNWSNNLMIYCYKGSEIATYAASENIKVTYLDNAVVSDNGNVAVVGKEENALEAGTILSVSNVATDKLVAVAKEKLGNMKYTVMDITLMKNGVAVQPKGKVTVSIDVPKGYDGAKCKVYYIANDGTFTDMKATFASGKLSFDTDHFSQYAIVEGTVNSTVTNTTGTQDITADSTTTNTTGTQTASPKTGDVSNMVMWTFMMMVCGAAFVILVRNKRRA